MNGTVMGRPVIYTDNDNRDRHIAGLIRKFGASGAREILNAPATSALAQSRNLELIPKPLGISYPTILKIARRHGVTLQVGRPKNGEIGGVRIQIGNAVA